MNPPDTLLTTLMHTPDHQLLPVHLLVFGVQTGITTLTCLVEMLNWQGYTNEALGRLCSLYVPYLAVGMDSLSWLSHHMMILTTVIATLMSVDAFLRLKRVLEVKVKQN